MGMCNKLLQELKYAVFRYLFRLDFLIAKEKNFGSRFKFKTEDVVGRHIYKLCEYEKNLTDYITENITFNSGDIAIDIGANIGWYSILINKLSPDDCKIYAFEPDPLNYDLLSSNIKLNNAINIIAVKKALSNIRENKKLYRYANKNLGRHSLLDINEGEYIEIEAQTLDGFVVENNIGFENIKFLKIDVEGYEYYSLLGAATALDYIQCLICEFVPRYMIRGGVNPELLIELLENKGFKANLIVNKSLLPVNRDQLLALESCDIVWLK